MGLPAFFSFLFPAWKFFSQTGTVFRIEARWENGPQDWQTLFQRHDLQFKPSSLLFDEARLSHLLAYSLVERFAQTPDQSQSPSLQLLVELIAAEKKVRAKDPAWVQVRLWALNPRQAPAEETLYFESKQITRTGDLA